MKCVLSVLVLVAVGAFAIPHGGYMYYKPATQGIMYVQYQKNGVGSQSDGVSAFVAGESGNTQSVIDEVQTGEDVLSDEIAAKVEGQQTISVAQGYNSESIAEAYPAEKSVNDYDGQAKVEVDAEVPKEYLPPNNEYLPPVNQEKAIFNEISNQESVSLTKTEDVVEEAVADDVAVVQEDVIPVSVVESEVNEQVKKVEVSDAVTEIKSVQTEYGVPKVEDSEREPKNIAEEAPAVEVSEVKTAEEKVETEETVKTISEDEESVKVAEVPVEDVPAVVESEDVPLADDDSTLVVEEPTPVVKDIPQPEPVPVVPVAPKPTKRTRLYPAKRPSFVPQRKKVYVQLEQENEEALEYVPAVHNRQVAKPKKEVVAVDDEEEQQSPLPLGGTFFPISFGGTSGGAIAIANSFSTSKGGSSKSQAVAYGSPRDSFRAKNPSKHTQADCDC